MFMLYVEFDSTSNGSIFRWDHRMKTYGSTINADFFRFFPKIFIVAIHHNTCAELRIKFCIE